MTSTSPLGRGARGLPRYYLDVGWHRHPTFAGLAVEALALFPLLVGYCTEHSTDGALPADLEDLAAGLGVRLSIVTAGLPQLIDRAVVLDTGAGLALAGWADHNPTAAEVAAHSAERSRAGQRGNHQRWHTARGIVDPDCPWCASTGDRSPIATDRSAMPATSLSDDPAGLETPAVPPDDRSPIATAIAPGSHGMGWDRNTAAAEAAGDRSPDAALDHLEAHIEWRGRSLANPAGYRISQRDAILAAAASGADLEAHWPTRHPHTATSPAHLPGSGSLRAQVTDPVPVSTNDRGAAVVDLDALRTSAR